MELHDKDGARRRLLEEMRREARFGAVMALARAEQAHREGRRALANAYADEAERHSQRDAALGDAIRALEALTCAVAQEGDRQAA